MNFSLPSVLAARLVTAIILAAITLSTTVAFADSGGLAAVEAEQRAIFEDVAPAVVFLTHGEGLGSGFFVSSQGDILTNAHVVEGYDDVEVVLHDGRHKRGVVVERYEPMDLAIVTIDVDDSPVVELAPMDRVQVGDWVASVGHGAGAVWSFTIGIISNIYPDGDERPVFQTQIPLNPGNSGGPIVDRRGRVLGVVTAGIVGAENLNFAVPVEQAIFHLEELATRCHCLVVEAPDHIPIYVDGVMIGTGPRVVVMAEEKEYEIMAVIEGQRHTETVRWPEIRILRLGD